MQVLVSMMGRGYGLLHSIQGLVSMMGIVGYAPPTTILGWLF
jgi:hypothetical protein